MGRPARRAGLFFVMTGTDLKTGVDDIGAVREIESLRAENAQLKREIESLRAVESRRAAEESARIRSEFAAFAYAVSHDLKEPLRKIQIFGDRLEGYAVSGLDERAADYVRRLRSAASRAGAMLDGLLEISRVNTRGGTFETLNLANLLSEVVRENQSRLAPCGAEIKLEDLPGVLGDPQQIRRLFHELLLNSVENVQPGLAPGIEVVGEVESGTAIIHFKDNGTGFPGVDSERIFEPFVRLGAAQKLQQGEPLGTGLTICRKIAQRHGGAIEARSQPGAGAEFVIRLPLAE